MNLKKCLSILIGSLLLNAGAFAKVIMPGVFSDNMVLQQKTMAGIWGTADAGKTVSITSSWNNKTYTTIADADGNWKTKIKTPSYGGPYQVTITDGSEPVVLNNVLIGEVWICSGQSNMEMPVAGWGQVNNYKEEIANANYPEIRLLQVSQATSLTPQTNIKVANNGWMVCSPQTIGEFSSVAYFFAREINKRVKIPIGLISSNWGGTMIEAWSDENTLTNNPVFSAQIKQQQESAKTETPLTFAQKMDAWNKLAAAADLGYTNNNAFNPDTAGWRSMLLPQFFEKGALGDFDGVVWFRKKITIPAAWAGQDVKISLGKIDDNEITFFNGEKIGATDGYTQSRNYIIPAPKVKAGESVITVRVFDSGGGGGLYGADEMQLMSASGEKISLAGTWDYKVGFNIKSLPPMPVANNPNRLAVLYNAMINPLTPMAIRGVIWYQGEANTGRPGQYNELFEGMINGWRNIWNEGNFPFYFVQLANWQKRDTEPVPSGWAELREAQTQTLELPNTGMAVAIDLGEADNIHPKNKQEVGRRLALVALDKTYHKKQPYSGPMYKSQKIDGDKIELSFNYTDGGLKAQGGDNMQGFAIAGEDMKFHWATAVIKGNRVIVSSPDVTNPVAVRYAWANNPVSTLYNGVGLPASPFRTDNWERK
ncbi:sialate O-acetylesterase [Mucilaginibacter gossypii]|uniref:sialate O-acetylesterase n=1 Tax=Mucilaginibacter gossypii TaxID=551996 RepID=UPI000DCD2C23|nr:MULTISPECIES: sialate O-acetylesterase [Mucilaginibacter]QTE40021.1 sialate O-acetylesterase [Mucilaginibacter gossypii]RAV50955.1 9-O-acetylesterase [Mucilaginibacter rubeus]